MQGVQILNEFVHEGEVIAPWFGISLGCCVCGAVGVMISLALTKIPKKILYCIVITMLCVWVFGLGIGTFAPRETTPRYQVIIDDEAKFNEFTNKYEIIEQNGLIYTVEERE